MAVDSYAPAEAFADERLVIPLRASRRSEALFAALSVIVAVGAPVWLALSPSWDSIIYGGGSIVALAAVWATRLAARRTRGDAPLQIIATRQGISSPYWSLDWDRASRMWIGPTSSGLEAIHIESMGRDDVAWVRSRALQLNARASSAIDTTPIRILQANIDRPLKELASDLRRIAGRPLS